MRFELCEHHHNVSDQDLIAGLKKVAQELRKDAITKDEYDERGKYCSETLRNANLKVGLM